jgi:hypothetical protein
MVQIQYFSFGFKREGDRTKHCRKVKRKQRARLDSIGRKCDTTLWRGNVGWRRDNIRSGGDRYTLKMRGLSLKIILDDSR